MATDDEKWNAFFQFEFLYYAIKEIKPNSLKLRIFKNNIQFSIYCKVNMLRIEKTV